MRYIKISYSIINEISYFKDMRYKNEIFKNIMFYYEISYFKDMRYKNEI